MVVEEAVPVKKGLAYSQERVGALLEVQQGHDVQELAVRACPCCMVWHPAVEEEQVLFVSGLEVVAVEQKNCASCQDCSNWGVV